MKDINHNGVVTKIAPDKVYVKIISKSACSECHAKGACGVTEATEKIIEVTTSEYNTYKKDDSVTVYISQKSGVLVVSLAYIVPTAIIVAMLIIFNQQGIEDNIAGLFALSFTVCYFFTLFLFKKRLNNRVKISISHSTF